VSQPNTIDLRPLAAVYVGPPVKTGGEPEYYRVGEEGVTKLEWGFFPGPHCNLPSVRVYRLGSLFSEHPFGSVLGVYFAQGPLAANTSGGA
jgi:hypothetical protein